MDGEGQPGESEPDLHTEVNNESLQEELVSTAVQEVEQPLLSGVRSVMPDVTTGVTLLRPRPPFSSSCVSSPL